MVACGKPTLLFNSAQEDNDDLIGGGAQNIMTLDGEIMALNGRVLTGQGCCINCTHFQKLHESRASDFSAWREERARKRRREAEIIIGPQASFENDQHF